MHDRIHQLEQRVADLQWQVWALALLVCLARTC